MVVGIFSSDPFLPLLHLAPSRVHPKDNVFYFVQHLFQVFFAPHLLHLDLVLPHHYPRQFLLSFGVLLHGLPDLTGQRFDLFDGDKFVNFFRLSVLRYPTNPFLEFCVVHPVVFQVLLELSVVVLYDLQFFFDEDVGNVVKTALNALNQLESLLLEVLLPLPRLL